MLIRRSRRHDERPRTFVRAHAATRAVETKLPPLLEALRELVSDTPRGGMFYQVQFRDQPRALAREILAPECDAHPTERQVDAYMHLLAAGSYNSGLYGTRSTSLSYPNRWLVPGLGLGLRCAWLPRNQDALDLYIRGDEPECVVDRKTGQALTPATSYGLVWCPPIELDALGEPTTEPFSWDGGATTLDPPPDFFGAGPDDR